jgi:hypothetical protein
LTLIHVSKSFPFGRRGGDQENPRCEWMRQESLQTNGQKASSKRETRNCSDMIFEYALEPTLLDNWKDIRYFKDQCGAEKGRLISQYPYKWVRIVFEAIRVASSGAVEKHRMKEAIRNIAKYKLFRRRGILWDDRLSWLENARAEHSTGELTSVPSYQRTAGVMTNQIVYWQENTLITPNCYGNLLRA